MSGWTALVLQLLAMPLLVVGQVYFIITINESHKDVEMVIGIVGVFAIGLLFLGWLLNWIGFFSVTPNDSRVIVFFGTYRGTVRRVGFSHVNLFSSKRRVSLRVRTFETGSHTTPETKDPATGRVLVAGTRTRGTTIKVNDRDGNPVEIAAVVVWRVIDTAEALFNVDNYEQYVETQSESALRNLASQYHYDSSDDSVMSLRGNTDAVGDKLRDELAVRLAKAGVEVTEARISSLAYAPEIAAAMLQRQQAGAVVAARQRIVDGAVGMVEMALARLEEKRTVELSSQQKAQMVANLLMVLCSERGAQPVLTASS
ncbi:MAG: SPFH domain-containing protein [Phycisphaerales bacterium]|nr:SPFH domain-containing protein [Phycisphaerales bacterium]